MLLVEDRWNTLIWLQACVWFYPAMYTLMLSFYDDIVNHTLLEELLMQENKKLPELDFHYVGS